MQNMLWQANRPSTTNGSVRHRDTQHNNTTCDTQHTDNKYPAPLSQVLNFLIVLLNVVMPSIIMPSVIMQSFVILYSVMPNVIVSKVPTSLRWNVPHTWKHHWLGPRRLARRHGVLLSLLLIWVSFCRMSWRLLTYNPCWWRHKWVVISKDCFASSGERICWM